MAETSTTLRIGILSTAHLHCAGSVNCLKESSQAAVLGVWDGDQSRGESFSGEYGVPFYPTIDQLLAEVDAVVITSENHNHLPLVVKAAGEGKHIICEKPVVAREQDVLKMKESVEQSGAVFMTAFPCRFSPAYQRLRSRVLGGDIGAVVAINSTNRGRCPFGWFVDTAVSGGGAMIDHVVHVTDLMRDLLQDEVVSVQAQIGNNVYGKTWEDTAMVTMEFSGGVIACLDSSWSRPKNFNTWGDVTMTVVGEKGLIELDMFGSGVESYSSGGYSLNAYGSNLDMAMVQAFVDAAINNEAPPVTLKDGIQAARVALAGYRSVEMACPVTLAS